MSSSLNESINPATPPALRSTQAVQEDEPNNATGKRVIVGVVSEKKPTIKKQ